MVFLIGLRHIKDFSYESHLKKPSALGSTKQNLASIII